MEVIIKMQSQNSDKIIFPNSKTIERNIQNKLSIFESRCPELFKLNQINDIFNSVITELNPIENKTKNLFKTKQLYLIYTHDKIKYRGTIYVDKFIIKGNKNKNLYIKLVAPLKKQPFNSVGLSNDGYIYSDKLKTFKNDIKRHHSETWSILDKNCLPEFESIINWCEKRVDRNNPRVVVFYNFEEERVDIKVYGLYNSITITFEPGYPEIDFNDEWFKDYDQDIKKN